MDRRDQSQYGKFARHETDPPRQKIFADLRSMYMQTYEASSRETAEFLEISAQSCSTLASGSDKRQPRWCLIFRLLEALGLELRMTSETINIVRFLDDDEWEAQKQKHLDFLGDLEDQRRNPPKAAGEKLREAAQQDAEVMKRLKNIEQHCAELSSEDQ